MRSKIDKKLARAGKRKRAVSPYGGKALLRLITFQADRDPALNEELAENLALPRAVVTRLGIARKPRRGAKAVRARKGRQARRRGPSAKAYAAALGKAARTRTGVTPRRPRAAARRAAVLVWQSIRPTRIPNGQTYGTNRIDVIGRVSAIAIDPKDAKHILLGAAGGGIWESDDTGATWAARTDQMPSLAIGAIAFDPKNAKRVYAGSGEGNFYSTLGAGVMRRVMVERLGPCWHRRNSLG